MITYFKDKNHKSKKRYEKYKTLNTILEETKYNIGRNQLPNIWKKQKMNLF